MIKILIFDDRFGARTNLEDKLNNTFQGQVNLVSCKDIYEAEDAIDEDTFDVIIVDSMMSTIGLDPEQEECAKEGKLTGVVWLCGLHKRRPEKLEKTLIYVFSAYLDEYTIEDLEEFTNDDGFIRSSIRFVSKAGNNIDTIVNEIGKRYFHL